MKKISVLLAGILCLSMVFTACGKNADNSTEPVTDGQVQETAAPDGDATEADDANQGEGSVFEGELVFWTQWSETETQGEVVQKMADDFMEGHPGVTIKIQWCGRDISTTLKAALESGEQIDLYDYPLQYGDQLDSFALDLAPYTTMPLETLGGKTLEESVLPMMLTVPVTQTGITNKLPAIGYMPYMGLFMYNASIFEEANVNPPTNWEEFDTVCAAIKDAGYSPITFDNAYALWMPGMYLAREKGQDWVSELVNDSTGELWKDDAVVNMAEAFADFAAKGYFDGNVAGNVYPAGQADMANDQVAMYFNGTWLPNEVADMAGDDFQWGAFNFPDVVAGAGKYETEGVAGTGMLSVNANCANPELAVEFLSSFYTVENDTAFVETAGHITSIPGGSWPDSLERVKPAFESVTDAVVAGCYLDSNADLQPVIAENFTKLCAGQMSAEEFVEAMASAAN